MSLPSAVSPHPTSEVTSPRSLRGGQFLTFVLNGEEYGVPILQVREIIEFTRVTPVPMTADWILGIINLRGNVVPVVDLARRFGLEGGEVTKRTCIVIVEVENSEGLAVVGIKVDGVREVADLEDDSVREPPAFGSRVAQDSLLGVGQTGGGFALLLDMNRVFPVARLGELDLMAEARSPESEQDARPLSQEAAQQPATEEPAEDDLDVEPDKLRSSSRRAPRRAKR